MKIVFMGSPEFARIVLSKLVDSKINIACIYTQPPRPAGRGGKIVKTAVHQLADNLGIEVRTPARLRQNQDELSYFKNLNCELAIVAAYGLIIPQEYLDIPRFGFINVHPSDLPKFRGAAPIQRTILSGDDKTAMCIMQMDAGLDTGDILSRTIVDISDRPNFIQLHNKLALLGGVDLLKVINNIENLKPERQNDQLASYANKILKSEGKISKEDKLEEIERKYRAFNPWPGIFVIINHQEIKIHEAKFIFHEINIPPGSILQEKKQLKIAFAGGYFVPTILQKQGKNKISVEEFLNGYDIKVGFID